MPSNVGGCEGDGGQMRTLSRCGSQASGDCGMNVEGYGHSDDGGSKSSNTLPPERLMGQT